MFKFVVLFFFVACALGSSIPIGLWLQLDRRIGDGSLATISALPYVVSLEINTNNFCGGSIYSSSIILTAGHCIQNVDVENIKIRAGSSARNTGGVVKSVASIIINPDYNANTMANDIALIKLSSPLTLGPNIQTIGLIEETPAVGTSATVAGWGTTSFCFLCPSYLQYKEHSQIVGDVVCSNIYTTNIRSSSICVSIPRTGTCQLDSGSPLVVNGLLVGIASWGYGCGQVSYPSVFTRISSYRSWIANIAV